MVQTVYPIRHRKGGWGACFQIHILYITGTGYVALPNMNPHYNRMFQMFQLFVDNENENLLP